eukprot:scaffold16990_cov79-Cyclotella_meneghiniana.AAC.1
MMTHMKHRVKRFTSILTAITVNEGDASKRRHIAEKIHLNHGSLTMMAKTANNCNNDKRYQRNNGHNHSQLYGRLISIKRTVTIRAMCD